MSPDFEAKADLGMNCGSGSSSLCDIGQLPLTSLSLLLDIWRMSSYEE